MKTRVGQVAPDADAILAEFPPPGVASRPEIATWQGKLRQLGLLTPFSNGRYMTGYEGPRTRAATRAFEQAADGAIAFFGRGTYKPEYNAIAETKILTGSYPLPRPLPVLPGTSLGSGGGFIQMFPMRADGTFGPSGPTPATPTTPTTPTPTPGGGPIAAPAPDGPVAEAPITTASPARSMTVPLLVGGAVLAAGLTWAFLRYNRP